MAEGVLLSIAIPTYNRESCLGLLLESICSQVGADLAGKMEVLVFDNCSTDGTAQVVERFLAGNSHLKYVRNEQNIGADNNFVKAFFAARGKYLWMIGDDELLFDGAISWVLDLCSTSEFGCAYLYALPETLTKMPMLLHRDIPKSVNMRSYSPYCFAKAANFQLTFLSASVVNRQAAVATRPGLIEDIQRFSGSNLVHLTWILASVLSSSRSWIVTTPIFAGTMANSGGYNPAKVFVANLSELFGYYFSDKSAEAKRFIRWMTLIGWFPKVVFDCRFRNRYRGTGYLIEGGDFPFDMQRGFTWWLFDRFVLRGSMVSSALAALILKTWHKLVQQVYLMRGGRVATK